MNRLTGSVKSAECGCGHARFEHGTIYQARDERSGACLVRSCSCLVFTPSTDVPASPSLSPREPTTLENVDGAPLAPGGERGEIGEIEPVEEYDYFPPGMQIFGNGYSFEYVHYVRRLLGIVPGESLVATARAARAALDLVSPPSPMETKP